MGIGEKTKDTAVIYVGGGVPKDFTQLLAISISPKTMDQEIAGREGNRRKSIQEYYYPHKYAIKIQPIRRNGADYQDAPLRRLKAWVKSREKEGMLPVTVTRQSPYPL